MSADLTDRIGALAREWEAQAPPIALDEVVGRTVTARVEVEPTQIVEIVHMPTRRPRTACFAWASAVAAAAFFVGTLVVAGRHQRDNDDVSPAPVATEGAGPSSVPQTTAAASTTNAPSATTNPPSAPPADFSARLAEIDAARVLALRQFTTIGFTASHVQARSDGTVESATTAHVVLRNDGSLSLSSETVVWSYFDAATGTARLAYLDADGQTAYQELAGLTDNSVPLGVPTGLPNGIVEQFPLSADFVVGVADDVVGGRPTWRIDRVYGSVQATTGGASQTMSIWIDAATGVTLQSSSTGVHETNGTPVTDTVTLSGLDVGAVLPAGFPGAFPDGVTVAPSGDPLAFGPTTVEQAAAEFGVSIIVPTTPADVVAISRMNFGNDDGTTSSSPSLIVRWFDGFVRTEYRLVMYPPSMALPDTCTTCSGTLLEDLRDFSGDGRTAEFRRAGLGVSITGPSLEAVREVIDSLVQIP